MVLHAIECRENKSNIENEIAVRPELRHIFTSELSLLGNQGRVIKELRVGHKRKPHKYNGRKQHDLKF